MFCFSICLAGAKLKIHFGSLSYEPKILIYNQNVIHGSNLSKIGSILVSILTPLFEAYFTEKWKQVGVQLGRTEEKQATDAFSLGANPPELALVACLFTTAVHVGVGSRKRRSVQNKPRWPRSSFLFRFEIKLLEHYGMPLCSCPAVYSRAEQVSQVRSFF